MDLKLIKRLIKMVEDSQISALSVEEDQVKIEIKKGQDQVQVQLPMAAAPVAAPVAHAAAGDEPLPQQDKQDDGLVPIKSPMVGTFYTASSPSADPFVTDGAQIKVGDVICVVEAMKLFNEIESEISGTVEKILVDNASPVEYGQALMMIRVA